MKSRILPLIALAVLMVFALGACGAHQIPPIPTPAVAGDATASPQADTTNDEGGPIRLAGSLNYTNFGLADLLESPSLALLDMVYVIQRDRSKFAPMENQILGRLTSPVSPPPVQYEIDLPLEPQGTYLDLDNDGEEDQGVQVFYIALTENLNGDSYQQQLDQLIGNYSYLTDPATGELVNGSLLLYAPDDQQAFPNGFGDDGLLFTEDDPTAPVPQGYTVVHFGPDGFTFDRAHEAEMNLLEEPSQASPDFSDQGIVESFNSLIDHLAVHYSFTDLRNLDWEAIRAKYLPMVEQAAQLQDPTTATAFYEVVLYRMAQSLNDAHVGTLISAQENLEAAILAENIKKNPIALNIGANTAELDDGRIIVTDVITGTPAAQAGLVFGTEVLAVNGKPVADVIPTVIYNDFTGTKAGVRLLQVANLLKFPAPSEGKQVEDVTIDVKLPVSDTVQTLTMTPGQFDLPDRLASPPRKMHISYSTDGGYGYLTWEGFEKFKISMAGEEDFLSEVKEKQLDGVILDLRGNGGGMEGLYLTMASYFFSPDNPISIHWVDTRVYDPEKGDFVMELPSEYLISAPNPDLYFDGNVMILVDNNCASSCEFFTQFMQTNHRATVVSQYPTEGAGGPIDQVKMPDGIMFQYTKGRAYFAGTDELNLEAKGVTPDVKVPVTEETEKAKLQGGDPVLDAGVLALKKAEVGPLDLQPGPYAGGAITSLVPAGWQYDEENRQYASPDQQEVILFVPYTKDDKTEPDQIIAGIAPQAAKVGEYEAKSGVWTLYAISPTNLVVIASIDGKPYLGQLVAKDTAGLEVLVGELLKPALDAFEVTQPQ